MIHASYDMIRCQVKKVELRHEKAHGDFVGRNTVFLYLLLRIKAIFKMRSIKHEEDKISKTSDNTGCIEPVKKEFVCFL